MGLTSLLSGRFTPTITPQRLVCENVNRHQITLRNTGIVNLRYGYENMTAQSGQLLQSLEAVVFSFFKGEIWIMSVSESGTDAEVEWLEE